MKTISIDEFELALKCEVQIYDTRPEKLFIHDALAGAKHLPLERVQQGDLPETAKTETVYLICEYGHISELVALYLEAAGFTNVINIAGGMKAWREKHKHFKLF